MSIAQTIKNKVNAMPAGMIFGYRDLPLYSKSADAVVKAVSRMVTNDRLKKFSNGKFYVPTEGVLGPKKPSDRELIRTFLYKGGKINGYVTGLSLYNKLGLTAQVPRTVTIACAGGRQKKEFDTIQIKKIATSAPITEANIKLLQYLDVLKDIKKIPDSDVNISLQIISRYISNLSTSEEKKLIQLALKYYSPQVRALTGLIFSSMAVAAPPSLMVSLNPTTTYKLKLDHSKWPMASQWNIK